MIIGNQGCDGIYSLDGYVLLDYEGDRERSHVIHLYSWQDEGVSIIELARYEMAADAVGAMEGLMTAVMEGKSGYVMP